MVPAALRDNEPVWSDRTPDSYAPIQPSTLSIDTEPERVLRLRALVAPHVESFNFALGRGLEILPETIEEVVVRTQGADEQAGQRVAVRLERLAVVKPRHGEAKREMATDIMPTECRRAGVTYSGELLAEIRVTLGDVAVQLGMRRIARIPVMVRSDRCNTAGMTPGQLISAGEEQYELGGYFVINGTEKALRMIVVPRANSVVSVRRAANTNRGPLYTENSVSIRCMRPDLSTSTMHMHYLRTGGANIRVAAAQSRTEYFLPVGVVMRALLPTGETARAIFMRIVGGELENEALRASALAIVTDLEEWSKRYSPSPLEPDTHVALSQAAALEYIGNLFKVVLDLDPECSNHDAGRAVLRRHVLVHLSLGPFQEHDPLLDASKVDLLVHMVRKLVAAASDSIELDNADASSQHEILLPGQLYLNYLKERVQMFLASIALQIRRDCTKAGSSQIGPLARAEELVHQAVMKASRLDAISSQMNYFLATGNIRSQSGLDLPQAAGYAIMAERINFFRFIMHFRCVHRGAFYSSMRTTKVRKLLPEGWGFICPVQTPDGAPCGLLNHLAHEVLLTMGASGSWREIADLIAELGADPAPALSTLHPFSAPGTVPIIVDGRVVAYIPSSSIAQFADSLRSLKIQENYKAIPEHTEIIHVLPSNTTGSGFYPGVYIHTTAGRMMRPVRWLQQRKRRRKSSASDPVETNGTQEYIGTMEQVFLHIRPAVADSEGSVTPVNSVGATHAEIGTSSFLSEVACLTPFTDMNQGPRNIFQCQMAKQAMGTPCHRFDSRFDAKVYRLTIPQVPITRNFGMQDPLGVDLFPNGLNGIVAVISYTGYDMEDALILNQGSVNRGFAHGTVYVNKRVNLESSLEDRAKQFGPLSAEAAAMTGTVDVDGLPDVGARLKEGDMMYVLAPLGASAESNSTEARKLQWTQYKTSETATIDQVQLINGAAFQRDLKREVSTVRQVSIRTRLSRAPSVGDKFATRAGQKGTVAAVWPTEDMPFSESGIIPDVLFNPNGFPSRMTIGMMIENMAGKAGALHGIFQDSTPFRFDEKCRAVDFFGAQLAKAGYNYYGNETLYSGYTGEPFEVEIFMGVIHYQRLRHMVSDKFQVRSTGKIHPLFRQPIKGRKRGGAIRFGEMERDGLLAHGASYLLRDRLAMASDMHVLHVCEKCGSILTPMMEIKQGPQGAVNAVPSSSNIACRICKDMEIPSGASECGDPSNLTKSHVHRVAIPYSFKYLVNELAAMNIRTVLSLEEQ
jgi:DNA-directed RNA polymerase I subunit RPA2